MAAIGAASPSGGAQTSASASGVERTSADPDLGSGVAGPTADGTANTPSLPGADAAYLAEFGSAAPPPGMARPAAGERRVRPPGGRPGETPPGIDLALRTLVVPDHADGWWDDMALRVADEPQLRLRPRSAVRVITQPPPVIDDQLPYDDSALAADLPPRRRRKGLALVIALVLSGVVVAGAMQGSGEDDDVETGASTTLPGDTGTPETPGATPGAPPTGEATVPPANPLDPSVDITPNGTGPLAVGATIRDLTATGVLVEVDQPTFDGSGGTCFDARVAGVADLELRFRSPDPAAGVVDPADGVLASVAIDAGLGSPRRTTAEIGLGASEDQVRRAYPEGLIETDHPFIAGGHLFTIESADGTGNGIAIQTDGRVVTNVAGGVLDVIRFPDGCG